MDPLSITASVIAVVGAAQESGKVSLKFLRNLKNAPRELQELIDEVTQIGTVLDDVKSAVEAGGKSTPALDLLLEKAAAKLLELEKLIYYELTKAKEDIRVDRVAWATHQKQVVRFQEQLRNIRHDITTVLSARTFSQSSQVNSQLSQVSSQLSQFRIEMQEFVLVSAKPSREIQEHSQLRRGYQALEGLCQNIEESPGTQEALRGVLGDFRTTDHNVSGMKGPTPTASASEHSELPPAVLPSNYPFNSLSHRSEIRMRTLKTTGPGCPKSCRCVCHKSKRFTSPELTRRWTGMATITYSGISRFSESCSLNNCKRRLTTSVTVNYTLPTWIASAMITLWLNKAPLGGPELLLRTSRLVSTDAYYFADQGMLEELRYMFVHGEASALDISPATDQSALMAAINSSQLDVVKFLMDCGADIGQTTPGGGSTKDDVLMKWAASKSSSMHAPEVLNYVDLEDIIDDQDFTSLHRIILGLTSRNLKEELQEHPEIVNATDTMGRTPLWWATHIGDVTSSEILLSFGADPSKGDFEKCSPLHNSAWASSGSLVEMLLDCGAAVTAVTVDGRTPLHLSDSDNVVDVARILLDHGADCNAQNSNGRTPLYHCTTNNSYLVVELLLQRGADQNIADKDGGRPWQTAVKYFAAQVLRVLSRHGCHFTDTEPDLSTVLHLAARYGDMAVTRALKEIDLSHIDADATDMYGDTAEDDLETRYYGDRLYHGWPVCSAKLYAALKDLIAHVRASNRRVHEVADSDGDTDDEEERSYSDGGTDDEEERSYSDGDTEDDEEERSYSDGDTEDEEECLFEDAREEWESPCPYEDLHGEPHDTNILSTPKGS